MGTLPSQAADQRYAYLDPGLPAAGYALFYATLAQDPLWKLPLAQGETQILRLQEFSLQEQSPFYWTRTRIDERQLQLKVQVSMEIWRGPELRWQRTVALERSLRLMGNELRGTGLALISPLAELPAGALSPGGTDAARLARLQQELLVQAAHQLLTDYQQHH
ncbi:MAG TPA: hypothetical protein V6D23_25890 [Candidatus Obscuribacterales bacterium]